MAITYPLTLPTNKKPETVIASQMTSVAISTSVFTGQQEALDHEGQAWMFQVTLPIMVRADAAPWLSFFGKLQGVYGTFLMGDDTHPTPHGVATGSPKVKGASQDSGNELETDGWTNSVTGILKAGDYIQFGSGLASSLHKVLIDADSDASGNATLTIWPALNSRSAPADNADIIVTNPKGVFRLGGDPEWSADPVVFNISFTAVGVPADNS